MKCKDHKNELPLNERFIITYYVLGDKLCINIENIPYSRLKRFPIAQVYKDN